MSMNIGPSWLVAHLGLKHPAIALCSCIGIAGYAYFTPANNIDPSPMVSFTFDDGRDSVMTAFDILSEYDMPGTAYITTSVLNTTTYLTHDQVINLFAYGWEIGAHTVTHPYLTEIELGAAVHEVQFPSRYLENLIGAPIFSFASPYGDYNEDIIKLASYTYDTHVNAWSSQNGINTLEEFEPYNIHRLDVTAQVLPEEVCETVRNLKDDEWFVLIFHQIADTNFEDNPWIYPVEMFQEIVECVHEADVSVVRVTEGADRFLQ